MDVVIGDSSFENTREDSKPFKVTEINVTNSTFFVLDTCVIEKCNYDFISQ